MSSLARGIAVVRLSIFYYTTVGTLLLIGGLLAWNGLSPGVERNDSQAHPVGGAILILIGIVTVIFFPPWSRKSPDAKYFPILMPGSGAGTTEAAGPG